MMQVWGNIKNETKYLNEKVKKWLSTGLRLLKQNVKANGQTDLNWGNGQEDVTQGPGNKTDLHALEESQQGAAENNTADHKRRTNRNEPGKKQKVRKKYKNGEKHEWTPEIKNISFTDSNSGLHHTTISNTVNVSVLFVNEKQKIKHVRFDEQLLKSAGFFSTFCRWISVKLQREEAEEVDLWIKPHQILSNAGRQSRREAGGTLQHWSGAQ